ncbi:DUF6959 family protein [Streptomyces echinatus]|uniref:DUF6959 family protein n=1 Tax=Streptomyces echinatus TaxID=67293 RepID=UPI0037A674F3
MLGDVPADAAQDAFLGVTERGRWFWPLFRDDYGWRSRRRLRLDDRMERIEAELFTDPGNDAVVRLPARRFPGVLIQGDSLSIIRADVAGIVEACDQGNVGEAREAAAILLSDLDDLLTRYNTALETHGIARPY